MCDERGRKGKSGGVFLTAKNDEKCSCFADVFRAGAGGAHGFYLPRRKLRRDVKASTVVPEAFAMLRRLASAEIL